MQKCLKFQFQSKILDKKIFVAVFTMIILFSSSTQVFAEPDEKIDISKYVEWSDYTKGKSPDTADIIHSSKIIFEIGKYKDVHVKHIIVGDAWGSHDPKVLKMLPGKHTNLQVTDEDGDYLRPIGFTGETFEESEYVILGQKAFSNYDLVMEYDLENFLELNDRGVWTKQFIFPHDVEIYFDDEIELIFANSRPVNISDAGGINCMGCDIKIEFFDELKPIIKKVFKTETKFEEITSSGEEFILEFLSDGNIDNLNFIEELTYLSFSVDQQDQLVLVKIPLDLLLSPYHVYLTELDQEVLLESDQIRKSEYEQTDTHANLSFSAQTEGVIHVVGATEMEHEKLLTKLQNRISQAQSTPETTDPASISALMRATGLDDSSTELDDSSTELDDSSTGLDDDEIYKEWIGSDSSQNNDYNIIFIIIGIIAVTTIVVIVIKLKKN